MNKIKTKHKLRVYWSNKEQDIEGYYPLGYQTQADLGYLFFNVFTKDFQKEIERRGYDLTTLKFEISPKLPNEKRFPTLTEIYCKKDGME